MNCIAVIAPKKKTVGTASACTASQRTVKIGYVNDLFDVIRKKYTGRPLDILFCCISKISANYALHSVAEVSDAQSWVFFIPVSCTLTSTMLDDFGC